MADRAIDGDDVAGLEGAVADRHGAAAVVDADGAAAGDAGLAHAACHDGCMRGHATARGEDAFGGVHAVNVFRRGFDAHQNDLMAVGLQPGGFLRREHDLARGGTRRRRQAGGDDIARRGGIDGRVQQLVERGGIDARHRVVLRDHALIGELDRDADRGLGGALAVAGLQHPEPALLDRELHVLHVAVVLLELRIDPRQLLEGFRHRGFHRRLVGAGFDARSFGDVLRGADAGDDVLALRVDQEFAVQPALAGRGIAREGDAGGRGVAHIAEHHGLHRHRGAPGFRNVVQAAIGDRARVHPGGEHRADGAPQLLMRILREFLSGFVRNGRLVLADQRHPVVTIEIGVERVALAVLVGVEDVLEMMVLEAHHDVGIHRDEAAIAVIGEALVAGQFGQSFHGYVVEAEVEDGIHHARHRGAGAGAHRHQQRVLRIAKTLAGDLADGGQRLLDLRLQVLRVTLVVGVVVHADRGRDGEAGGHGQAEIGHLGEVGALAAEQVAQTGLALSLAAAERIDPLAGLDFLGDRLYCRLGDHGLVLGNNRLLAGSGLRGDRRLLGRQLLRHHLRRDLGGRLHFGGRLLRGFAGFFCHGILWRLLQRLAGGCRRGLRDLFGFCSHLGFGGGLLGLRCGFSHDERSIRERKRGEKLPPYTTF